MNPQPAISISAVATVSVIVVVADSGPSLLECAERALAAPEVLELWMVDNASSDGVPQQAARRFAQDARWQWLETGCNLGFGPAVNRAAWQARGKYLLILNPDCLLAADTLPRLLAALAAQGGVGLLGAVVCDEQGRPDPASWRRDPLLRRAWNTLSGRARNEQADPAREGVNIPGPPPAATVPAEAVSGALMLLPRDLFVRLGGFDEAYFLHCEDLDLCRRVRDAGAQVWLAGDIQVTHAKGGSSRHRPVFVSWHKHRGMWRWFRKFDPAAQQAGWATLVALGLILHFLAALPGQAWRQVKARQISMV